jgi:pimeloyl-ACP methyl ester carboxylesterase/DNA-binding CsgD family transcriptional regulator
MEGSAFRIRPLPWPSPWDRGNQASGVTTIGSVLRPEVRYAHAVDGVTIAYSVVGEGPVTMVVVSPLISQLELAWEEPALEHFWSRFAACARVVLFDRRGAGLSDRSPRGDRVGLAALALDIRAVLDACDAGQAVLFGVTFGCPVVIHFSASYPGRAQALVLAGGFAKLTRLGEFDFEADPAQVDVWARRAAHGWGTGVVFGARAPSMRDNARYRDWAARMERHTCSPGSVEALARWAATVDVRPLLAGLRVPALVIHRRDDRSVPATDGRYLAEHIHGAEYAELPGEDHTLFLGDQRIVHRTVIGFLDRTIAGGAMRAALRRADRKDAAGTGWAALTPSEREVAVLIASGMTNSQVAARLHLSPHTVDGRLRRVFAKLGVNTRVELTAEYARVNG